MDSKKLNEYLSQLDDMERKAEESKRYLTSLRLQIKERVKKLSEMRHGLKSTTMKLESMSSLIPTTICEVICFQIENKTLCKQIEVFEQKIADLKQKELELNESRKERVNKFIEESFSFCQNYGLNGRLRTQSNVCKKLTENLKEKRNELKSKTECLDQKQFESIIMESNSLKDQITNLERKQTTLQREHSELKLIDPRLTFELKQLKDDECQELNDLKKELQKLENMEKNEIRCEIKCEPSLLTIDSNDESCEPGLQPVVISQETKHRFQSSSHISHNQIKVKKEVKCETSDDQIWRLKRLRNLRRKSNN